MQIRIASETDLHALEALFDEVDAYHRERLPARFRVPDGPARSREHLAGLVRGPDTVVLLADDGEPLGFATVQLRDMPPIFTARKLAVVDSLGVAARARRQGVGRALMAAAETWAGERGAHELELTVYDANSDAIAFYEALGYSPLSRRLTKRV